MLNKFDAFAVLKNLNDDQKVQYFILLIRDVAERWYVDLDENQAQNWNELRPLFIARFHRIQPRWLVDQQLSLIKQRQNESVDDYSSRLREKCAKAMRTAPEILSLFLQGLRHEIKIATLSREPNDFENAFSAAKTAEIISQLPNHDSQLTSRNTTLKLPKNRIDQELHDDMVELTTQLRQKNELLTRRNEELQQQVQSQTFSDNRVGYYPQTQRNLQFRQNQGNYFAVGRPNFNTNRPMYDRQNNFDKNRPRYGGREIMSGRQICRNCNRSGHMAPSCPERNNRGCYSCGQIGHIARNCPRPTYSRFYSKND